MATAVVNRDWRLIVASTTLVALHALALPMPAAAQSTTRFALAGEGRALELGLGDQGLTLGVALARADSTPTAAGAGAGQCELLGDEPEPDDLPCNESTAASSSYPGNPGTREEACAGPGAPAPLDSVLYLGIACGSSASGARAGLPFTVNAGKIAEAAVQMDLSGLVPQVEDAKEDVIDELRGIIGAAPEPVRTALESLLHALDDGEAGRILIGGATSDVTPGKNGIAVESSAAAARVGVVGIPDLDEEGLPQPGTSNALEDGLIIVEVGAARASATVNLDKATAVGTADPAIVTVKVRDITQVEPTYVTVSVAPGETQTILAGTPLESTITAADATVDNQGSSATAVADAVRLHLVKGVQGGIVLALGRTTAAAQVDQVLPKPPKKAPEPLPQTGSDDTSGLAAALLLAAAVLFVVARRKLV